MRISVDPDDPGALLNLALRRIGAKVDVYLDGEKCEAVITADDETGEVVRLRQWRGAIILDHDLKASRETLRGTVRIEVTFHLGCRGANPCA